MTLSTKQYANLQPTDRGLTLRIIPVVAFSFVLYFSVGIPLAILPSYVHLRLGVSTFFAGLLISLQYIATFASRPRAGHMADTLGPKRTVMYGLVGCAVSGGLVAAAWLLQHTLWLCLTILILSRFALGIGESMAGTGAIMWGIGRVGEDETARVISWNGVATYTGLAVGAPMGALLEPRWGLGAVGLLVLVMALVSLFCASRLAATAAHVGERVPLKKILLGVSPYGLTLALGGMGFGVIGTFITLYFAHQSWGGAALSLTIYGVFFICVRLMFSGLINRYGGFPIAIGSFAVEAIGLFVLGSAGTQYHAYVGAGLTGSGFSLIFPALGIEAGREFPISSRGMVLGIYSAFVDLSLFLIGPIAGAVIGGFGYPAVFYGAAFAVVLALAGTVGLTMRKRADSMMAEPS
ncbi:MAG TPA: MFS transporter [Terriglobales bacterium]|nr:MFS transporter [Terriglobales bacterium]